MEELVRQATIALRGMWRYRWIGLAFAWLVAIAGAGYIVRIPNQYEASARIFVDTQSILKPLMTGLIVQPNIDQQVAMLSRTLLSRPNLEKLVRMADLDLGKASKLEQETLIDDVARRIQIRNTGRDNLYTLAFRDPNQDRAKRVVQSLSSIFVESSLGATRKDADSARNFLSEQIRIYEGKLEEAESRMKAFKMRNLDQQLLDGKDAFGRAADLTTQLQTAQLQLREAENARDAAKAQLAAEKSGGAGNLLERTLMQESSIRVATPEIDARIAALKVNLDALLQRYTEQHPDTINARRMLVELEEQKKIEVAQLRKAALANPPLQSQQVSMAQQELQRMVAAAEVQVATIKARVAEYNNRLAAARDSIKSTSSIEAEASQLNRDYAVHKRNYDELVARRQTAIMSGEMDGASGVAEFRLIDPPRVSPQPVEPNRLALLPLALFAAIGAGLALPFLLSQVRPTFDDPVDLPAKTGLPLLGVVTLMRSDVVRRRDRMSLIRFASASGGLLGLFAIGMVAIPLLA